MGFSAAIVLAYVTGMVTAYVLARLFVFRGAEVGVVRSATWFALVNLLAVLQTWAVSVWLAYQVLPTLGVIRFDKEIAHFVGIVVPVFTSFIGHKYLSFRSPSRA